MIVIRLTSTPPMATSEAATMGEKPNESTNQSCTSNSIVPMLIISERTSPIGPFFHICRD